MKINSNVNEDVYDVEQAGKLLGLGERAVLELIRKNELKASKVGRRYLILKSSIVAFVASKEQK